MSFPQWPTNVPPGSWKHRSPCDAQCMFMAMIVTTSTGTGRTPCRLRSGDQHAVTYRNIGGVTLSVAFSATACAGLTFTETGQPNWSESATSKPRSDWRNAKRMTIDRTVNTSGHPGGPGNIEFEWAIHDSGLLTRPDAVHLSFTV
jgi:hypothetical protein